MHVLIVEDEHKMALLLRQGLTDAGIAADLATTGEDALIMAGSSAYEAIVLDVMLPGLSGVETCQRLRAEANWTPVVMLTARDAVGDRITGLDAGADDYLVKPITMGELRARLRALIRRAPRERPAVLEAGPVRLDPAARRAWRSGKELDLSAREFALLETFLRAPGQVLSRRDLLESVWDHAYENRSNIIDVYVRHLRRKLDEPYGSDLLQTVRGVGYRFEA